MRLFLGLVFPLPLESLFLRSSDQSSQIPRISCDTAGPLGPLGDKKATGSDYERAYWKAFYDSASVKLFQASEAISDKFRKLDSNGDGVIDCSELGPMQKQLELVMKRVGKQEQQAEQSAAKELAEKEVAKLVVEQEKAKAEEAEEAKEKLKEAEEAEAKLELQAEAKAKAKELSDSEVQANILNVRAEVQAKRKESCQPKCNWKCAQASCDQVCKATCETPQCQTRCTGMKTDGCTMQCGAPRCVSVCAPNQCGAKDCPLCKMQCGKPQCKLACPPGTQNCRDVCETPRCTWLCTKPEVCPQPACTLTCDQPKDCQDSSYKELPALNKDEIIVQSFEMPMSFQQQGPKSSMSTLVAVTQVVAEPGSSELKIEKSQVRLPVTMVGQ